MSRPELDVARAWRPAALRRLADEWDEVARTIHANAAAAAKACGDVAPVWAGAGADGAGHDAATFVADGDAIARALVLAAVAARDGAEQISAAQAALGTRLADARESGFDVRADGVVTPTEPLPTLLIALSGGDTGLAATLLASQAAPVSERIAHAVHLLAVADADAADDIVEAFDSLGHPTDTAVGNANGVPWEMRVEANRTHVAQAIVDGFDDRDASRRSALYRRLLGEVDDPAGSGRRIDRKILAFDPAHETLVELIGDVATASSVAVLIPGMNTTIEGSAGTTDTAGHFVSQTRGRVAAITYLGGPFPASDTAVGALVEAADPHFAMDMAPGLVAFSRDVDATVDATGRSIPVTYIGHSYGGAILGTAEALGLTADRTLYAAAAGAGFGVDGPGDWHNRNPHVLRFSMTAPGDPIQLVQGLPGSPHGTDPDQMAGVIHLATGHYDDGRPMAGLSAHSDILGVTASDAWRNVLAVITGDGAHIVLAS